ncbi:MAG TPA: hypothetical protein VF821_14185 [Lentzea sp.]
MTSVLDDLLELAATRHLGAVRLGMPLAEAEAVLGPATPHPALRLRPNSPHYPYLWTGLRLFVSDGRVSRIVLEAELGAVDREAFLDALRQKDITVEPWPEQTHGSQIAVRTSTGAEVLFVQHGDGCCVFLLEIN